uniref:Transmembrane protein n=2 Tax=Steinernema glaseri TaxID=37863 RepID=A0A1I8A1S3_9BILA
MKKICPLCGPSLSAFCMLMSVWGVIFLGLLGVFFSVNAVSLFPDLHFKEEVVDDHGRVPPMDPADIRSVYSDKASQCWIAAGLYLVTLIVVMWQNRWNRVQIF